METYNFGQNKMEQQTPIPANQGWSRTKAKTRHFRGESGGSINFPFILSKIIVVPFLQIPRFSALSGQSLQNLKSDYIAPTKFQYSNRLVLPTFFLFVCFLAKLIK